MATPLPTPMPPTPQATGFAASFNNAIAQALGGADFGGSGGLVAERQVNETCLELLNAELVDMWTARAEVAAAAIAPTTAGPGPSVTTGPAGPAAATAAAVDRDAVFTKIEAVGFSVGQRLAERYG